jgi:RNA recognition motif-containing protein
MSTKIHVGNISSVVLEDDLKAIFSQFGFVETVEIARDPVTGTNRGFAIVAMSRDEDASAAIARLNFTQYAGRTIGVSRSRAVSPG